MATAETLNANATAEWGAPKPGTEDVEAQANEELAKVLKERWETDQANSTGAPDTTPIETPVEGQEATPPPSTDGATEVDEPAPPAPTGDTETLDAETIRRYRAMDEYFAANPEIVQLLGGVAAGQYNIIPVGEETSPITPSAPSLPDEVNSDDPTVKYLLGRIGQSEQALNTALERLQVSEAQIQQQGIVAAESIVNRAVRSFQSDKGLNDEQVAQVRDIASRMNVLPALMSPVDPISNLPRKVDQLAAVEQALDAAYWSIDEYRDQEIQRQLAQQQKDRERQAKLSSLGGASGPSPRQPKEPTNDQERRQAMIEALAPHFS